MAAQPTGLQERIDQLDREAREHKRQERQHRDQARNKRRLRDELIEYARNHGIPVIHEAQPERAQP